MFSSLRLDFLRPCPPPLRPASFRSCCHLRPVRLAGLCRLPGLLQARAQPASSPHKALETAEESNPILRILLHHCVL